MHCSCRVSMLELSLPEAKLIETDLFRYAISRARSLRSSQLKFMGRFAPALHYLFVPQHRCRRLAMREPEFKQRVNR